MNRTHLTALFAIALAAASSHALRADVKTDERALVRFEGMLGRVAGLFGGRAAREGVTTTVAVKGNRKVSTSDQTGQIVDLQEERIYDLDLRRKTYKVTTFAEIRRQMEEARKRAEEDMKKAQAEAKAAPQQSGQAKPADEKEQEPQVEMDFDLKETGQKKSVNGFAARQYLMTITVREKGKKLEESGGMVLTSDIWMTPSIPGMKEVSDFDMRYAKALAGPMISGASANEMASAMAMYPMMKDALARMRTESVKMEGTPVQTITTLDAVQSAEQAASAAKQESSSSSGSGNAPAGVGGLLGGIGRRIGRGNNNQNQNESQNKPQTPGRATIMTMTNEILKVSSAVSDAEVAVPAGFKESR